MVQPLGRPSDYSQEIVDAICERLANGQSLRRICTNDEMPDRSTVLRWLESHDDFAAKYARARDAQADYMDDLILDTADACTPLTAISDRVKIGAYQWRGSKLKPKKYGDRTLTELTGLDGGPIIIKAEPLDDAL
jgi:hypothetical protein